MRGLLVVAVVGAAAAPAHAGPTVPKALEHVDLRDGGTDQPDELGTFTKYTLRAVTLEKRPVELAGRRVIVFRQRYRYHAGTHHGEISGEATELAVVDAATGEYLLHETVEDRYTHEWFLQGKTRGTLRYKAAWRDANKDGEAELWLTRTKATGLSKAQPKVKVLQLRRGRFQEVSPELAACPADDVAFGADDLDGARAAVADLLAAIEGGAGDAARRCAYLDAMLATAHHADQVPLPATGAKMTLAPAAPDCPARAWLERRGETYEPVRTFVFLTAAGDLGIASARGDRLEIGLAALDEVAHGLGARARGTEQVERIEARVVDQRLYVLAVVRFGAGKKTSRHAVVYDPVQAAILAQRALQPKEQPRFAEDRAAMRVEVARLWSVEVAAW